MIREERLAALRAARQRIMDRLRETTDSLDHLRLASLHVETVLGDRPPTLAAERCARVYLHCGDVYEEGLRIRMLLDRDGDWMDPDTLVQTAYMLQAATLKMSGRLVEHESIEVERLAPAAADPEVVAALHAVKRADSDCLATLRDLIAEFGDQAVRLMVLHILTGC